VYERIPKEIVDFLSSKGGRSLLIKGSAGTGKTTFALQVLEELGTVKESFYLSTRVSDDALYRHFPWLKDKEMRDRIIDASRVLLEAMYKEEDVILTGVEEEEGTLKAAKKFLSSIYEEEYVPTKVDRTRLSVLLERNRMPEVERIYDSIDHILPKKSLLVIDSVEGITHKYGLEAEELIYTIQKDLVENSNTNILLVLEKKDAPNLEYLVDGVVSLSMYFVDGRLVRQIKLEKLRATRILQPNYLITLDGGRFRCIRPFDDGEKFSKWSPVGDKDGFYSTGIPDLDAILGGGLKKGSYNVIEIDENVTNSEYLAIVRPILLNFISNNRGVMAVLSGGDHPENLKNDLCRFIDESLFRKWVRIVDYFSSESSEDYILAMSGKSADEIRRMWLENINAIRGGGAGPIIDYTGFDTLEYLRGDTIAIKDLFSAVAQIKISKDVGIGVIKPGLKIAQEIMNMADTHLRIIDINRTPCIYGIKPKTIMHAITVDPEKGLPYIKLVPIV